MSSLTRVILLIVLLIVSAFFSMTECALSYTNKIKLKVLADEGKKSADLVLKCLDKFDNFIITGLIGNNVVNIFFSVLTTSLCSVLLTGVVNPEVLDEYTVIVSTVIATILVFFFGEIIPKSIGKAFPTAISRIAIYPLYALCILLFPLVMIFRGLLWLVKKIFKAKEEEIILDEDDFQDIVDSIEEQGLIEKEESEIIQSAVEFDDMKVKQVMCVKENIVALDIDKQLSKDELIDYILDNPYTRIPVYKDNLDHIIGILHTQKLLKSLMLKGNYDLKSLLVDPIFVRPNVHIDTIFDEFKKKRTHMAVVQDKEGHTIGIVTMEDVLDELVGGLDDICEGGDDNE